MSNNYEIEKTKEQAAWLVQDNDAIVDGGVISDVDKVNAIIRPLGAINRNLERLVELLTDNPGQQPSIVDAIFRSLKAIEKQVTTGGVELPMPGCSHPASAEAGAISSREPIKEERLKGRTPSVYHIPEWNHELVYAPGEWARTGSMLWQRNWEDRGYGTPHPSKSVGWVEKSIADYEKSEHFKKKVYPNTSGLLHVPATDKDGNKSSLDLKVTFKADVFEQIKELQDKVAKLETEVGAPLPDKDLQDKVRSLQYDLNVRSEQLSGAQKKVIELAGRIDSKASLDTHEALRKRVADLEVKVGK